MGEIIIATADDGSLYLAQADHMADMSVELFALVAAGQEPHVRLVGFSGHVEILGAVYLVAGWDPSTRNLRLVRVDH